MFIIHSAVHFVNMNKLANFIHTFNKRLKVYVWNLFIFYLFPVI